MDQMTSYILALLFIVMVGVCLLFRLVRSLDRRCNSNRRDLEDSKIRQSQKLAELAVLGNNVREELVSKLNEGMTAIRGEVELADTELFDSMKELRDELTALSEKLKKVDELIDAHAEAEAEAAKSERLFQEGLSNILNYGVKNSG